MIAVLGSSCAATPEENRALQLKAKKEKSANLAAQREVSLKELRDLGSDEIYLVGRIDIIPRIRNEEKNLDINSSNQLTDKFHALFNADYTNMKNVSEIPLYENFIIKVKKSKLLYFSGGDIWLESDATHSGFLSSKKTVKKGKLHLPGNWYYKIRKNDKAIYVGTIRYYRNTANAIKKVRHISSYSTAEKLFSKRIRNSKIKLREVNPRTLKKS